MSGGNAAAGGGGGGAAAAAADECQDRCLPNMFCMSKMTPFWSPSLPGTPKTMISADGLIGFPEDR